jgi:hypothetical protein
MTVSLMLNDCEEDGTFYQLAYATKYIIIPLTNVYCMKTKLS